MSKNNAGKGDKPRSCFSKEFKENFDAISWKDESLLSKIEKLINRHKKKYNTAPIAILLGVQQQTQLIKELGCGCKITDGFELKGIEVKCSEKQNFLKVI